MQKNKASVLGTALIVLGMILAIAIGVSTVSMQERRSSIGSAQSSTAYQNADTGVERVLNELIKVRLPLDLVRAINISGAPCNSSSGLIEDSSGKFRVELKDLNGQKIACNDNSKTISSISSIKSAGISAQENRAIEVIFTKVQP